MDITDKKILYDFGCCSREHTEKQLDKLINLAVDPEAKHRLMMLQKKIKKIGEDEWIHYFYIKLRREMEEYLSAQRKIILIEKNQ